MEMDVILQEIPKWQFIVFAALFGAAWGSFANVVIVRLPLDQSVLRPGSHCMACREPVRFYDNIPVLSYLLLRGRCRFCKTPFSPRYAVIELASALLSVAVLHTTLLNDPRTFQYGLASYFIWFMFITALLTAAMIDLDTFLLPDVITLPGIVVGILVGVFVFRTGWIWPVASALMSYGVMSLLFVRGYKLVTGRQGMGEGDPKFLAMIASFILLRGAVFTLFAAAFQGLIAGTVLLIYRKRTGNGPEAPLLDGEDMDDDDDTDDGDDTDQEASPSFLRAKVPFGPFLALGAVEYYFFGERLITWYASFIRSLAG